MKDFPEVVKNIIIGIILMPVLVYGGLFLLAVLTRGLDFSFNEAVLIIVLGCVGKIEQTKKHKQFSDKISLKVEECLCQTYFIT